MCLCVFVIFLDILWQKVTALLSFVFVDSVPKIKAKHSGATVFANFYNGCECSGHSTVSLALAAEGQTIHLKVWCY